MHDLYDILEVSKDASSPAIKKAYRLKALQKHPDKGGTAEEMILLIQAYETLYNSVTRKEYDRARPYIFGFYDLDDTTFNPSGYLPSAGIAFSETFKQAHRRFVEKYSLEPLDQNRSSSCLNAFTTDLYSSDGSDLFSHVKSKGNQGKLESKEDVGVIHPEKAVEHFMKFLKGDYYGDYLKDLSKAFYREIKHLQTSGQEAAPECKLYCGIYTIFLIAVKERTPTAKTLFSLQKITDYTKHNIDKSMKFMAPLLQSKYFRCLFSQALHCYWLSEEEDMLDEACTGAFSGPAAYDSLIESLKLKLSAGVSAGKLDEQVLASFQYVRVLAKLEKDLAKCADVGSADFYRENAMHLLDWMPVILGLDGNEIAINTLLQIGIAMQKAASHERTSAWRMADEKLAAQIYILAVAIGNCAKPAIELYALTHCVKFLTSCRYRDSEFDDNLRTLQRHALKIADLFPFFQAPQPNADFFLNNNGNLILMRQLLHALISKIEDEQSEPTEIEHSHVRVLYEAYEACLKNWYQEKHEPEVEEKFRQRLMQELLASKQWTVDDLRFNLKAPWPLDDVDEQGWTRSKLSILSSARQIDVPAYKTIRGVEFNVKSGQIDFILEHCQDNDNDGECLLTSFDLSELIQRRLVSTYFSLDPVKPDMTYHPFNQIDYKPSRLHHSQLLHAMFMADYMLKFLTIGQEIQRRHPYELRSLDEITRRLPDHLQKVIFDFHASKHEGSVHRFWIEADEIEFTMDSATDDKKNLFAIGDIRMVVNHRQLERQPDGKLVDKTAENEGWDCYVLDQCQERELYSGRRIIKGSALLVIKDSWQLIFWEYQKVMHRFRLDEDEQQLILLSKLQRDSQQKVKNDNPESLRQIYRVVSKAAEKAHVPNGYSPEFIFAQEFTKYYDEFAVYIPEFGRLRELAKAMSIVGIMANFREGNQREVDAIKRRLDFYQRSRGLILELREPLAEVAYWEEIRDKLTELIRERVMKQFEEWRGEIGKQRPSQLLDVKRQIQKIRNYQLPSVAKQIKRELSEIFQKELAMSPEASSDLLIGEFLRGYDQQLLECLIVHDRYVNAEQIRQQVYPQHTTDLLYRALNNSRIALDMVSKYLARESLQAHERQLKERLIEREKLEQSFDDMDFGADTEEVDLAGDCLWVPAAFRHDVEGKRSRTVYGGVYICPRMRECVRPQDRQALLRQTRESGRRLQRNRLAGNAVSGYFKENVVGKYYHTSKYIIEDGVHFRTPVGSRFFDVVVRDKATGKILHAYEVKAGKSPYTRLQRAKDKWIYDNGLIPNPVKLRRFQVDTKAFDSLAQPDSKFVQSSDKPEGSGCQVM